MLEFLKRALEPTIFKIDAVMFVKVDNNLVATRFIENRAGLVIGEPALDRPPLESGFLIGPGLAGKLLDDLRCSIFRKEVAELCPQLARSQSPALRQILTHGAVQRFYAI
jgi:hypothetical protein